MTIHSLNNDVDIDFLRDIGSRIVGADPLHDDLAQIVEFASAVAKCDSCFVYLREGDQLILRASKNPHQEVIDRLKVGVGGTTRSGGLNSGPYNPEHGVHTFSLPPRRRDVCTVAHCQPKVQSKKHISTIEQACSANSRSSSWFHT